MRAIFIASVGLLALAQMAGAECYLSPNEYVQWDMTFLCSSVAADRVIAAATDPVTALRAADQEVTCVNRYDTYVVVDDVTMLPLVRKIEPLSLGEPTGIRIRFLFPPSCQKDS